MLAFRSILKTINNCCHTFKVAYNIVPLRLCSSKPSIDLSDSAVLKYFEHIQKEYWDIKTKESVNRLENNRLKELLPIVKVLEERSCVVDNLKNLEELKDENAKDPDMVELMKEERSTYNSILKDLDRKLLEAYFPTSLKCGSSDTILEISMGVGGQESMLFAGEMLDMYVGLAKYNLWDSEVSQMDLTDIGGVRKAILHISGEGAYETLRWEGGVHRVQRVPATERSGRLHTSTVSIAVMLQPTEIEMNIPDRDIRFETKRASGAGGQHVNTTDSAVRVVHIPTGTAVECQTERDQHKNKKSALGRLRALLYQQEQERQEKEERMKRKTQVGSGLRNEKIRTYNYNQDRVTDHRLASSGTVHGLKTFMQGGSSLHFLIMKLHHASLLSELLQQVEEIKKDMKQTESQKNV